MINGITITLIEKVRTGTDEFNQPIYTLNEIEVENVLVTPLSNSDIVTTTDLNSDVESYQLAIPKGDNHNWRGNKVRFWNKEFEVVGIPQQGIESLIPLQWNKKVTVERHV